MFDKDDVDDEGEKERKKNAGRLVQLIFLKKMDSSYH